MGLREVFSGLFGGGPSPAPAMALPPASVPGAQNLDPRVMQMLQQFGFGPPDDGEQKRRALASALAKGGAALSNSTQDFLPALSSAIGAGAVEYTGTRESQAEDKRKQNMDILKQMFGLEKLDQTNDIRTAIADMKQGQFYDKLDEVIRSNKVKEGQGGDKIIIMGQNADTASKNADTNATNAVTNQGRAAETGRHNLETEAQGRERIKNEAAKTAAQIKKDLATAGGADGNGKADNAFFTNAGRVQQAKLNKARELGLDKVEFSILDRDGYEAAKRELAEFSAGLDAELAATGSPTKRRALGATENVEKQALDAAGAPVTAKPAPPAQPGTGVKVDDLGLPADIAAKVVKRITKNGRTQVKLNDGRTLEIVP